MAAPVPFAIVDVFSNMPYKGNPLAVVDNTTANLSTEQMKLITRQFNLSETTFFSRPLDSTADFALRSFLPDGREVSGAGHNILGVWWYLANVGLLNLEKQQNEAQTLEFKQLLGGEVSTVKVVQDQASLFISLRQSPPGIGDKHPDPTTLTAAIGLGLDDIGLPEAPDMQPQVVSTSTARHLHVPVRSIDALNRLVVQRDNLLQQLQLVDKNAIGLFLFTSIPGDKNKYQARFFSPGMSGEDPATGSAAGPLSAFLYNNGLLDVQDGIGRIEILQGLNVGRECKISVALNVSEDGDEERLDVDIEGTGVEVAKGKMIVPSRHFQF